MGKDGRPEGFVRVLWGTKDPTNKAWLETQTLYTYNKDHQVNKKYFSETNLDLESLGSNFLKAYLLQDAVHKKSFQKVQPF